MQVFSAYFKIMKKQIFAILIYVGIFLTLSVFMSMNFEDSDSQFEESKVKIMVVNEDEDNKLIEGFLEYLGQYVVFVTPVKDEEALQDALYYQKVVYILKIPKGFSETFMGNKEIALVKQTAPDSMDAITVDGAIDNYFNMARIYLKHIPGIRMEQLNSYVKQNLKEETQVSIAVEVKDEISANDNFNNYYFNYMGYIMIACFITGVSIVMFSFNGIDIRRRHFSAPISNRNMNVQLILANLVFVLVYLLLFILVGYFLNKERFLNVKTILFWINSAVFALVVLSFSYLVAISVKSKKAIAAISTATSLSLAFLSGMFVPQEYLGASVIKVASFTPTYWFVKANNTIGKLALSKWSNISEIIVYMAIQLGFAAAIISIALVVSKRNRQQAN